MLLADVIAALEQIAPTRHAESWDNVGLLAGDPDQPVRKAILTIDYTRAVAAEAQAEGCDLVIAYHPPIFDPLKRLVAGSIVFDAIRRGVAIYSPHTALDVADGGTNDMLADILGLQDRQPLRPTEARDREYKLITFVPHEHLERVSQALFDAGAGRIGSYSHCSFRSPGTGTFFGEAGTNPAVGQSGRLETAEEVRIETIVPIQSLAPVLQALRQAHPYETPAFDLVRLAAAPEGIGQGRIGRTEKRDRTSFLDHIKRELGLDRLLVAGPTDGVVERAACCAGACGNLLDDAIRQNADLYLTGEMRHHDALKAAAAGMTVVCTLHSHSERKVLPRLADRLRALLPDLQTHLSRRDADPFSML
jgi:dinuclear metal center YbgI/SA1388 family protein